MAEVQIQELAETRDLASLEVGNVVKIAYCNDQGEIERFLALVGKIGEDRAVRDYFRESGSGHMVFDFISRDPNNAKIVRVFHRIEYNVSVKDGEICMGDNYRDSNNPKLISKLYEANL